MQKHVKARLDRMLTASVWALLLMFTAGCGDGPAPAPESQPVADPAATTPAAQPSNDAKPAPTTDANDPKSKTKWIGGIPYDVFYDQPLVVASESTSLAPGGATTAATEGTPKMTPPPSDTPPAEAVAVSPVGGPDWKQLADAEVLNEEVTRLRNALMKNLKTLATYNRNIEAIANDAASLAALAAVVEVHPDNVRWKDKAKYVRDLGYEISMKADGTGRTPYDAANEPFEQIVGMLNGGPPPDADAQDKVPFADIADRSELMKRIKVSYHYLRTEINTADRFKESADDIVREAAVLASFGGMISTDSYDSADEEKYQQFIRDFIQANIDVSAAVNADDFAGFDDARNRIQKACHACHGEYAFGDEGF